MPKKAVRSLKLSWPSQNNFALRDFRGFFPVNKDNNQHETIEPKTVTQDTLKIFQHYNFERRKCKCAVGKSHRGGFSCGRYRRLPKSAGNGLKMTKKLYLDKIYTIKEEREKVYTQITQIKRKILVPDFDQICVCFIKEIIPTVADSRTSVYIHFVNDFENENKNLTKIISCTYLQHFFKVNYKSLF